MALSLASIQFSAGLSATLKDVDLDGGNLAASVLHTLAIGPNLTSGTTADKCDRVWQDQSRALSSGGTESLNLYSLTGITIGAGAGLDALGRAWSIAEIVGLVVYNLTTSAGTLIVGGEGTSNAWHAPFNADVDAKVTIKPGGFLTLFAPTDPAYAVGSSANNLLKFEASGGAVTYSIAMLARSA